MAEWCRGILIFQKMWNKLPDVVFRSKKIMKNVNITRKKMMWDFGRHGEFFLTFLFRLSFLFYVYRSFCLHLCSFCMKFLQRSEEGIKLLKTGVTTICDLTCRFCYLSPCSLEEPPVPFSVELSCCGITLLWALNIVVLIVWY